MAAVLREPARPRDLGPVRLAVDRAAREERGVAAEDEPVDRLALGRAPDDRLGLRLREQLHHVGCRERAGLRPPRAATTASSSTPGAMAIGSIPAARRVCEPGRRRGGEVQAHAPILPVRRSRCGMLEAWPSPVAPVARARRRAARRPAPRAARDRRSRRRARRRARRPRRRLRGAPRGAGRVRLRRDPGRARVGARHRPATRPVLARRDARGAAARRRIGASTCGPRPPSNAHPSAAPAAPSSATSGIGRQRALKAEVLRDALSRMGGVDRERRGRAPVDPSLAPGVDADGTGLAHPRAAAGRRRRRGRPVRGAEPHRRARGIRAPRGARARSAGAARRALRRARVPSTSSRRAVGEPALVVVDGERMPRGPRPIIEERVGDRTFRLDRDGFWQVHRGAAATLTPSRAGPRRRRPASIRGPRTSTSTAGSACSPRRSATGSATPCASRPSSPTRGPPSTPARTSPTGWAREP